MDIIRTPYKNYFGHILLFYGVLQVHHVIVCIVSTNPKKVCGVQNVTRMIDAWVQFVCSFQYFPARRQPIVHITTQACGQQHLFFFNI
jgi:hypothetical protein